MKILITSDWYLPTINGVVNSVTVLKDELIKEGHEVEIVTLSPTIHSYKVGNVTYIGSLSVKRIYPEARLRSRIARDFISDIINWKPDVIHSQCEFSTFTIATKVARATSAPIIHTYHTVYEDYSHYFLPSVTLAHHAVSAFSKFISKHVNCLIAPTEKIRELLLSYKIRTDIRVVPSGIDLSLFTREHSRAELSELKESLGIPENNKVILNIGRIAKEKNIDEIIRAVGALKRRDVTLLLVGDGPYRPELEKLTRDTDAGVVFAGMIPHNVIGLYYRLGDIFVSASTSETQGLTYDEALASGLPCLCRKDRCIDGVIVNDYNGWQFESFEEFLSKLSELLSDEEKLKTLGKNAKLTGEKFGTKYFAGSMIEIYKDVAAKKAAKQKKKVS